MFYFKIEEFSKYVDLAENYFPVSYIDIIKHKLTYEQSIVARFFVSRIVEDIFWVNLYLPLIDDLWKPVFDEGIYWSISHSSELILVWVGNTPLWVDIEKYKIRDNSLMKFFSNDIWNKIWEKNWDNYYRLWTIYESSIKYYLLWVDDMSDIFINNISNSEIIINWIKFLSKSNMVYKNEKFVVYSGCKNNFYYAIASKKF